MNPRFDTTIERIAPSRAPGLRSDVAVPLAQSLVTGVLIGGPLGYAVWTIGGHWGVIPALILVATGATWFLRLPTADKTMWVTDRRVVEPDAATPEREVERIIGLHSYGSHNARDEANAAAQTSRLAQFLREAIVKTTTPYLEKKGFKRTEIDEWRQMLMDRRYAEWRNPSNHLSGWQFYPDVTLDELLGSLTELTYE